MSMRILPERQRSSMDAEVTEIRRERIIAGGLAPRKAIDPALSRDSFATVFDQLLAARWRG
jgi:hypothetical protein